MMLPLETVILAPLHMHGISGEPRLLSGVGMTLDVIEQLL